MTASPETGHAAAAPLWEPSAVRIERANITAFVRSINERWSAGIEDYDSLHRWSVAESERFWLSMWDFGEVVAETRGERVLVDGDRMPGARWFPDARLNFAENLLRRQDGEAAILFHGEDRVRRGLTFQELYDQVSRLAQALRAAGVGRGDRVAGYVPNMPETVVAMLATTSLGAVWSSCSPDFGVQGVLDRFGQIEPKVLFSADGYYYGGRQFDSLDKLGRTVEQLPSVERVVVIPYTSGSPEVSGVRGATTWNEFIEDFGPVEIFFEQVPFDHPLYIMYSSGTTGVPKCIVHGVGGTLLQHLKEHRLHTDVKPGDRVFYFTTCGWMMWNWLATCLASEATLLLYDGSPFHPDGNAIFDFADREGMNIFGTSAKFIDAVAKAGLEPARTHNLESVRTLLSTGSPLMPESFDFVYRSIKSDICLSSISGGTDIISCFVGGNPTLPVYRGEIQCAALAMDVQVYDDDGRPVATGEKGELVCTNPFPSMPVGFWNDPDGSRYRAAYFEKYPGVWCHGDYVARTHHGGFVIYGRSDAVLNPGGVRIGTAEIYRQAEQIDDVVESLVVGQQWKGDVRVVLFVRLREGVALDDALIDRIRRQIRENTTPRHVPAKVVQVEDIPRTKSGKIVELAVRSVVHGEPVSNREALANPEALDQFRDRSELAGD